MQNNKIIIFTDGGSRGNPGKAGVGAVICDEQGNEIKGLSKFLGNQTNNWAEYEAVVLGLEAVQKAYGKKLLDMEVVVKMDSQLVQRQLSGEYQIKEETLFPQYIKVHNLIVKYFKEIKFVYIPRAENERADELANQAMDQGMF